MNSRHTWFWVILAAVLFAFIFFFERHRTQPESGPARLLPELKAEAVTAIQVHPAAPNQPGIRAERTNSGWQLTQPLPYPALASNIDKLVTALAGLLQTSFITPAELSSHRNAQEEYGFTAPQASIIVQQGNSLVHLLVGAKTPPGDEVYVQIVGRAGVYLTDAEWLKAIPKSANDWRDPALLTTEIEDLDRLAVTNSSRAFLLEREPNKLWRMVWPLTSARADNARVEDGLQKLAGLHVRQFVSDDPKADLETFGLAHPALELSLGQGSNNLVLLQFGKSVPGDTNQIYCRRSGQVGIFAIDQGPLELWRGASVNDFRDPHLLTLMAPVAAVDIATEQSFSIQRQTNDAWRVLPEDFPADSALVQELLSSLTSLQVMQFTKDVVNAPELPEFGLGSPARRYLVKAALTNSAPGPTNCVIAELDFGLVTNQPEKVFVRRADESSVYAVSSNDFARLPSQPWQMRERRVWNFSPEDIAGVRIRHGNNTRELIRKAAHQWSFAPGSQGMLNDLAVEETVRGLSQVSAVAWVARGEQSRERFGLLAETNQFTINLKNGTSVTLEFGKEAPSTNRYTGVVLDGQLWVFECPWILYRDFSSYLAIP